MTAIKISNKKTPPRYRRRCKTCGKQHWWFESASCARLDLSSQEARV